MNAKNRVNLVGPFSQSNLGDDLLHEYGRRFIRSTMPARCELVVSRRPLSGAGIVVFFGGTQWFSFSRKGVLWFVWFIIWRVCQALCWRPRSTVWLFLYSGFGPFANRWAERKALFFARRAAFMSVRDEYSAGWLEWHRVGANTIISRDPVLLDPTFEQRLLASRCYRQPSQGKWGFILRDWRGSAQIAMRLAVAARELSEVNAHFVTLGQDRLTWSFWSNLALDAPMERYCGASDAIDFSAACVGSAACVVSMRFHGAILALLLERPVICIDIDPKFHQLRADFGDWVQIVSPDRVTAAALRAAARRFPAGGSIREIVGRLRQTYGKECLEMARRLREVFACRA